MKRTFAIIFSLLCHYYGISQDMDVVAKARQYPIEMNKPAVNFFEGAVLGNGGLGIVVVTRPDAVVFHFGHNNVWDIRVAENNRDIIGTFDEIFKKAKALSPDLKTINDDKEFKDYLSMTAENYRKSYPRPFPCGTVVLGFDRRQVELLGHKIDISNGVCEVYLLNNGVKNILEIFTGQSADILWFRLIDEKGTAQPSCFNRLRVIPDGSAATDMPRYTIANTASSLSFTQTLPYQEPDVYDKEKGHPKDRAFRLEARLNLPIAEGVHYNTLGIANPLKPLERYIVAGDVPMIGNISLREGLASEVKTNNDITPPETGSYQAALQDAREQWATYWNKSGVDLADDFLEKIWYWNHYFFNCAVKAGVTCPGLFANWSRGSIGTAWHGDYHMNYNTQQPFWLPFSSNRLDKNIPYVDMVHHLLPISRKWAKEYYGMRGAFFPHSAYPVDMTLHPYPVPDWGWEVFETPWTVQGLWWHYLYSMDVDFLKNRAYEPIKDAVMFLVDYMTRPDAHGAQWNDDKYHIFPSVPPELYGLQPGFKYNYDTQVDITLTKFIFNAFIEAVDVLKYQKQEAGLLKDVKRILSRMPEYSTAQSEKYGLIYTSVPEENDKMVYNLPANLLHVFPGEEFGIDAPKDVYNILVNTFKAHQNEGGNDIVMLNLQAARLGILDVEKFKRQVNYAMLPNKTVADYVLQSGGRYVDETGFDWMGAMGMWFENFALPVVINECLMQSYNGVIHLYPNWDKKINATFTTLRAAGAFLVSSKLANGTVFHLTIHSEKGGLCKLKNPWGTAKVLLIRNGKPSENLTGELLTFKTSVNERIVISRN
ncbi:MAG: glycoside hydrolase N-terminal domain-containing protein [Prevotellaceae bacterium]|nr:glycoside hydrolase N-terminal domain-containing protein [Prevotellaceae bacterium]